MNALLTPEHTPSGWDLDRVVEITSNELFTVSLSNTSNLGLARYLTEIALMLQGLVMLERRIPARVAEVVAEFHGYSRQRPKFWMHDPKEWDDDEDFDVAAAA